MPVRSLHTSILKWPRADQVREVAARWANNVAAKNGDVMAIGYFGSYARGDWGVGSDLDLVVVLEKCDDPPERRTLRFDVSALPVPVDLLVITAEEWKALRSDGMRRTAEEMVWLYGGAERAE